MASDGRHLTSLASGGLNDWLCFDRRRSELCGKMHSLSHARLKSCEAVATAEPLILALCEAVATAEFFVIVRLLPLPSVRQRSSTTFWHKKQVFASVHKFCK